ncbi:MAG: type II secretion system F family protein [Armatimonadetes bacterium]|nr:type II secretion system F family protein [Armatimonadota bacterium]
MPQFSFSAIDGNGRPVQGVVDAGTENELIVRLSGQGLRVQSITRGAAAPTPATRPPAPAVSTVAAPPVAPVRPVTRVAHEPRRSDGRPYLAPAKTVRTKRATYKQLMFLFAQTATMLRSGVSPADTFQRLSVSAVPPHIAQAAHGVADMATAGISMADAMAVYPDVFPEAAVGAVRAGENGGYAHEACRLLSVQYEKSHRMMWHVRFLRWATMIGLSAIPVVESFVQGLDRSFADMSGVAGLGQGMMAAFRGWSGLWLVLLWACYFAAKAWMRQTRNRDLRHALALKVPVFAERAKKEGLAAFTFHTGRLSQAGLSPNRAWTLAAAAVPNQALGRAFAAMNDGTSDGVRLGDLVRRSELFPRDYANILETGEATGTLPQALEYVSQTADRDRSFADRKANWSLYGTYILLFIVFGIVCGTAFYTGYFNALYKHTVGEAEAEP